MASRPSSKALQKQLKDLSTSFDSMRDNYRSAQNQLEQERREHRDAMKELTKETVEENKWLRQVVLHLISKPVKTVREEGAVCHTTESWEAGLPTEDKGRGLYQRPY